MSYKQYRVIRTFGGSYGVYESDFVDDAAFATAGAAGAVAGVLIGASLNGLGRFAQQRKSRAIEQAGERIERALEEGALDQALALARKLERKYKDCPDGPFLAAVALAGNDRYDEAMAAIGRAVARGLPPLLATQARAGIAARQGALGQAVQDFSLLIQQRGQDHEVAQFGYQGRAQLLLELNDLEQALADANQAPAIQPDATSYCLRGDIQQRFGRLQEAVEDYTRAIRLDAESPIAPAKRAAAYEQLGRGDDARADREAIAQMQARAEERRAAERRRQEEQKQRARTQRRVAFGAIGAVLLLLLLVILANSAPWLLVLLLVLAAAGFSAWFVYRNRIAKKPSVA